MQYQHNFKMGRMHSFGKGVADTSSEAEVKQLKAEVKTDDQHRVSIQNSAKNPTEPVPSMAPNTEKKQLSA